MEYQYPGNRSKKMKTIELLAPAKDMECGMAAIRCGADAVYIGAPRFGARENAGNTIADITSLIQYAHTYWAKIYVTVNTLLTDEEIPAAAEIIYWLYEAGVDGVIIQDMGLLECDLPPVALIASTQMHNNTPEKVAFLEQTGFQRAILARELDIEQIKAIREAAPYIELESFVHGALCVCYSGQCYLSYALGGRSGNRGECAQPCRKRYTLTDKQGQTLAKDKHLLSIRDLNLSQSIPELIDAGIRSFKIEGRLKDATYVSNIVAFYRQEIDKALEKSGYKKSSSGYSKLDFIPDPAKTFNRGYTDYFMHGRKGKIGTPNSPKMTGEPLGKVKTVNRSGMVLETKTKLHPGDGICFFTKDGRLTGTVINAVKGQTISPDKTDHIEIGMLIYRNHDHEFLNAVRKTRTERRISVNLLLQETHDGLCLTAVDENGVRASAVVECVLEPAKKPEMAIENICKQLQKAGDTNFSCAEVDIEFREPYFIPISVLNDLRRKCLENLASVRDKIRPKYAGGITKHTELYPENKLSYLGNVLNRKAEAFYRKHGVDRIEPAAESGIDMHGKKVMTTRYCLKSELDLCPKQKPKIKTTDTLILTDADRHKLELRFNCENCEMEMILQR